MHNYVGPLPMHPSSVLHTVRWWHPQLDEFTGPRKPWRQLASLALDFKRGVYSDYEMNGLPLDRFA